MKNEKKSLPEFLTQNYYFCKPATTSHKRKRNETAINDAAYNYFKSLGFDITADYDGIRGVIKYKKDKIEIFFGYYESCRNVYRIFKVYKNGSKSNRKIIVKIVNKL